MTPEKPRLSTALMHVPTDPKRRLWAMALRDAVPGLTVVEDSERAGVWSTARRAWLSFGPSATHHMVLQDDFQVCRGFLGRVRSAVAAHPNAAISAFAPPKVPEAHHEAAAAGRRFYETPSSSIQWGGTVVLPTEHALGFVRWADVMLPDLGRGRDSIFGDVDDVRLSMYLRAHGVQMLHTVPELVLHVGAGDSIIGHAADAWRFGCDFAG